MTALYSDQTERIKAVLAIIRSVLGTVDDPHAFATAYVAHAELSRASGGEPLPVTTAVMRWHESGRL